MSDFETEGGGLMKMFGVDAAGNTVAIKLSPTGGLDAFGGGANLIPNGADEVLAVSNAAGGVSLVGNFAAGTTHVLLVADDAGDVKARWHAAPIATRGYTMVAGDPHVWKLNMALTAKFIRRTVDTNILAIPLKPE